MLTPQITDALGWSGYFFCGFAALSVVVTVLRKRPWKHGESWLNFRRNVRHSGRGIAQYGPVWFAAFCCLGLLIGAARIPKYNVVTEHNVAIVSKLENGDFAYTSTEKPDGDTYRPCSIDKDNGIDVDGLLTGAIGYVAERATWQERGTCRSILKPEWQFWFRDEANNFHYRRMQ